MRRPLLTLDDGSARMVGTGWWDSTSGNWKSDLAVLLPTSRVCLGATTGKDTGYQHLVCPDLDLRKNGVETGRISCRFQMMVKSEPYLQAGAGGFTIFQWGVSGVPGTLTLSYVPVTNYGGTTPPHTLVASVVGDIARTVTVPLYECEHFMQVFLEYDGTTLTLVAGQSADQYMATEEVSLATSPNTLQFAADVQNMYFMDLFVFNAALIEQVSSTPTSFPFMMWDADDSGVIATIPTPTLPEDYFVFIDRGYTPGHQPATINLATSDSIVSAKLFVNERPSLLSFTGGTAEQFVAWLATTNNGRHSIYHDGREELLQFDAVTSTSVKVYHVDGEKAGQLSFTIRIEGTTSSGKVTGGLWGKNVAIIGKIPQQWALPHTGEPNRGISILGASNTISTPKSITVEYRDDSIRTAGKVIGDVSNRPGAGLAYTRLNPTNFFGSNKAPFPKSSLVYGNPNEVSYNMMDTRVYAYGMVWERFINVQPADVSMWTMPFNRSRAGDCFAAFSIDIPLGQTLRGITVNFTAAPPGLRGNAVHENGFSYNWGEGTRSFPFVLTGSADYTCLFYVLIATDPDAKEWRTIPSIGADAVKVSGANVWKEIQFRQSDFDNLKDANGLPMLMGARRVHFKLVLAHEVTYVTYQGMSYRMQDVPKK